MHQPLPWRYIRLGDRVVLTETDVKPVELSGHPSNRAVGYVARIELDDERYARCVDGFICWGETHLEYSSEIKNIGLVAFVSKAHLEPLALGFERALLSSIRRARGNDGHHQRCNESEDRPRLVGQSGHCNRRPGDDHDGSP